MVLPEAPGLSWKRNEWVIPAWSPPQLSSAVIQSQLVSPSCRTWERVCTCVYVPVCICVCRNYKSLGKHISATWLGIWHSQIWCNLPICKETNNRCSTNFSMSPVIAVLLLLFQGINHVFLFLIHSWLFHHLSQFILYPKSLAPGKTYLSACQPRTIEYGNSIAP